MTDPSQNDKMTIRWAIFLAVTTIGFFVVAVALISQVEVEPTFQVPWVSDGAKLDREQMPVEFRYDEQNNLLLHRGKITPDQEGKLLKLSSAFEPEAKLSFRQSIDQLTQLSNVKQTPLWFLLFIAAIGGIIGVQARSINYFIFHACVKNDLNLKRWWAWYSLRPLLGLIFGPLVVLLTMTGVQTTPGAPRTDTLTMFVLSILVGVVASMFFEKLVQTAQTLLGLNSDDAPAQPPSPLPDPVVASGHWDEDTNEAVITWTKSVDPNLDHYEVRMTPAATYDANNHKVLPKPEPGTLKFRTKDHPAESDTWASFKVYVVLKNASEAGSEAVPIRRPPAA